MGKQAIWYKAHLDLLILKTVSLGRNYGWAIANAFSRCRRRFCKVQQGSLYPALHRLERMDGSRLRG